MKKIGVAVLGATGMVGQRFIQLLINHPYFEIRGLMAQKEFVGKRYREVCNWIISEEIPSEVREISIKEASPEAIADDNVEIVFSAVPAEAAKELEPRFAWAGYKVFSNASAFRMEKDVPLLMAEVNPSHLALIKEQREKRGWKGFIVTNPNCTTIVLTLVLKPLLDNFGIGRIVVSTMQALSGAGYPGVASLDILDNVLPYIKNEEEKVEEEPLKILDANFKISVSCHRVAVIDGHLEDLHISFPQKVEVEKVKETLENFGSDFKRLPSSPEKLIIVREESFRPQPRLDRMAGNGFSITVGRIREDRALENGIKMNIFGHNTIRGAAGQSVLNAEYWVENQRYSSM